MSLSKQKIIKSEYDKLTTEWSKLKNQYEYCTLLKEDTPEYEFDMIYDRYLYKAPFFLTYQYNAYITWIIDSGTVEAFSVSQKYFNFLKKYLTKIDNKYFVRVEKRLFEITLTQHEPLNLIGREFFEYFSLFAGKFGAFLDGVPTCINLEGKSDFYCLPIQIGDTGLALQISRGVDIGESVVAKFVKDWEKRKEGMQAEAEKELAKKMDKIKAEAEENTARIEAEAKKNAAKIEAEARENAAKIEAEARENAAKIEAEARENAAKIEAEAKEEALAVLKNAEKKPGNV